MCRHILNKNYFIVCIFTVVSNEIRHPGTLANLKPYMIRLDAYHGRSELKFLLVFYIGMKVC